MELRLNSSASECGESDKNRADNNCTSSDGNEELLERVLREFVPRSRSRRRQQEFLEKKEEVRANDEDDDDDDNTNNSDSINAMIKDVSLIDVSGIQLKETTKTKTSSETSTSLAELHQQRENERVRSLAQTSSEAVRSAVLEWSAHKQNVFLKRFATQASDDAVLELNLSSWTDTNNNSVRDEKQFFRDYTNINRNVEDKTPGTPNRASSLRSKSMNIDIDALFRNEDKFGEERLQELENASSQKATSKDIARTTQRDCVERLQKLNDNIARAWLEADRVAALKLSIKVVKLLGYNAGGKAPEFYPILFFLVTDIADTVGQLVYKRIKAKAENKSEETYDDEINDDIENTSTGRKKSLLPENWNSDDIRDSAKATCRNWFFKVASIRELVPRLYLEFALLDCMRFLRPEPPVDRLNRLIAQIKGVGDPLVSAYLRCYAAKKIATVLPEKFQKDALKTLFGDFISRYVVINDIDESNANNASAAMRRSGLKKDVLVRLMHPSLAWILSRNIKLAESSTLERSIQMCSNEFKGKPPLSFLSALFETLSEEVCAENAMRLVRLVKDSSSSCNLEEDVCDCAKCFIVLGKAFARVPPQEQYRLDVLMEVWKVLGKWNEDQLEHYAGVTDAFVDFVAENFTRSQLEILLKDLAKRVKKSRAKFFDGDVELAARRKIQGGNLAKNIENICTTILFRFEDISLALSLSGFSYLVDQLGGSHKVQFSRKLLERIGKSKHRLEGSSVINHAFEGAKAVHDSVDPLALRTGSLAEVDESMNLFDLVTSFVSKVHFEASDVDAELRFLMNCRSAFTNADGALIKVVQRAIAIVKHCVTKDVKNNEKTKAQAASCVAFCQITIPSVENIEARLNMIVETAKYATACELHAQVDGVISSAIQDIEEAIGTLRAERVHAFVSKLSEVLMDNPAGHPEYGSFYAIATASTMLEKMTTDYNTECYKAYAYLALAYVVAVFAETCGTLNKKNVELFGGSERAFVDECCTWAKDMVSKAADVAFNESPTTTSAGEANIRIACAVFDLFKLDSKETKKTIQTLVRRAEVSEMFSKDDKDSDLLCAHRLLKEMCTSSHSL
jgi:hypothetical protein